MKKLPFAIVVCAGHVGTVPRAVNAAKPGTMPPVPLVVTVHELDSDGAVCGICSDGLGNYSDGVDGVAANIDQYGNIIINFQTTRAKYRALRYDYSRPLGGQPANWVPPPSDGPNNYLSTTRGPGAVSLQAMIVGATQCVDGGPTDTFDDVNQTQYRHNFHRAGGFDVSTTSWLVVTRTSATTWDVEPKTDACNDGVPKVARVVQTPTRNRFSFTDDGLFEMPFKMTLTAK